MSGKGSTVAPLISNLKCRHQRVIYTPLKLVLLVVVLPPLLSFVVHLQGGDGANGMDVEGAVGGDAIVLHEDKK